ncbi:MAG TPA: TetR/AcrR family transcriptional regulator [Alphaproteobacteria bacterium]|nr:TetR/AcrR family transcriptional regulator [Alphaproteobacteria bacterium]
MSVAEDVSPKDRRRDSRRRAMIEAASALFLEKGYGATSVGDIVKRSGGSLTTLYALFGDKQGLFRAIVEARCAEICAMFDDGSVANRAPHAALREHAERLFDLLVSPEVTGALRLIIAEGGQSPELAREFFGAGPDAGRAKVAAYLAELDRKGAMRVDDPLAAAEIFCDLVRGEYFLKALCGVPLNLDRDARDRHLTRAVDAFMRIYRVS